MRTLYPTQKDKDKAGPLSAEETNAAVELLLAEAEEENSAAERLANLVEKERKAPVDEAEVAAWLESIAQPEQSVENFLQAYDHLKDLRTVGPELLISILALGVPTQQIAPLRKARGVCPTLSLHQRIMQGEAKKEKKGEDATIQEGDLVWVKGHSRESVVHLVATKSWGNLCVSLDGTGGDGARFVAQDVLWLGPDIAADEEFFATQTYDLVKSKDDFILIAKGVGVLHPTRLHEKPPVRPKKRGLFVQHVHLHRGRQGE